MVRKGKERADAPDQSDKPESAADARWLNGVNRQLQPDAQMQRLCSAKRPPRLLVPSVKQMQCQLLSAKQSVQSTSERCGQPQNASGRKH